MRNLPLALAVVDAIWAPLGKFVPTADLPSPAVTTIAGVGHIATERFAEAVERATFAERSLDEIDPEIVRPAAASQRQKRGTWFIFLLAAAARRTAPLRPALSGK
jgi:hypothetical protein